MEFSTGISEFNTNYNLNAIADYNRFLQNNSQFAIDTTYANLGVPAPDSAAKVQSLIDAVKANISRR